MKNQFFSRKLQKTISTFLIAILLLGKLLAFTSLSVYADDAQPTDASSQSESTQQSQPTSVSSPPSVPAVPTAPPLNNSDPVPTVQPVSVVPTVPSGNNSSSDQSGAVPTVAPTGEMQPTVPPNDPIPTNPPVGYVSPTGDPSLTDTYGTQSVDLQTGDTSGTAGTGSYSGDGSVNDPANTDTGAFSLNQATENLNKNLEQVSKNLAELNNKLDLLSNTGFNVASLNTLSGNIFTGDANISTNLFNKLNSNVSGMGAFSVNNIYGNQTGDIVFKLADSQVTGSFNTSSPTVTTNASTGAGSDNVATASGEFTIKEANGNDAVLTNDITLNAISGDNKSVLNTGNGIISTGDANALANIINLANTNLDVSQWLFGVINIFGSLTGNIILPDGTSVPASSLTTTSSSATTQNSQTGTGSENTAVYETSDTSEFKNVNTSAIATNVDISSNTGNNASNGNTSGGSITTGDANADVNSTTVANTNIDDPEGTVWIVMVNELGKWFGKIIGASSGAMTASNLPATSTTGGGEATYADSTGNSQTGEGSVNTAENSQKTSDSTQNTNNAVINNNIKVNADTGNNAANYNTGAGIIETGDANAGVNILNLSNLNIKAKKIAILFVNVLGEFIGNVVTPGQENIHEIIPTQDIGSGTVTQISDAASPVEPTPTSGVEAVSYVQSTQTTTVVETTVQYVTGDASGEEESYLPYYDNNLFAYATNPIYFADVTESPIPTKSPLRGIYLSQRFMKATESTFPGVLLGGVSLKVNERWLSVIPLAVLIFVLRRRQKIDFSKYLNMIFDIVL